MLAILQNQWFRDPERVRGFIAAADDPADYRRRFLSRALFAGCLTGRRLRAAFGADLCREIIWEEASPEIGGHSSSVFPADRAHVAEVIRLHLPDIILAFGKVAQNGLAGLFPAERIIAASHPAARGEGTVPALVQAALRLRVLNAGGAA